MRDSEALLAELLELPKRERAEFAARLLDSLETPADDDVDEAWAREIERRAAAVDRGELETADFEVLRRRIERDIFGR